MNNKILIIGSGALGSAFANMLIDAKCQNVLVYGIDDYELNDLKKGQNTKYFGSEIKFNKINVTNNFDEAIKDATHVVLAVPSIALDKIINDIIKKSNKKVLIINGCKGFYPNEENSIHSGIEKRIKNNENIKGCVTIAGPSFASEIIQKSMTTICAISNNLELAKEVQSMFYTNYFKLYTQIDVIGAEIGGIYKNILAIGSGMLFALGYKINTIASYLTRGMKEMKTFNEFMGGKSETIYGLTGLGDLILTATDSNSRNYSYGKNFVLNEGKIDNTKNITLEGLTALSVVEKIRLKNNLYLPICESLYKIIYEQKNIKDEISNLWNKDLKRED